MSQNIHTYIHIYIHVYILENFIGVYKNEFTVMEMVYNRGEQTTACDDLLCCPRTLQTIIKKIFNRFCLQRNL